VVTIHNQWYHTGKHGEMMDPAISKPQLAGCAQPLNVTRRSW